MTVSEKQLEVWANQGAVQTAQATHQSVRAAIDAYSWPDGWKPDAFLQGSYRNSTNIRGDSDVDLVVQLHSIFKSNISSLSEAHRTIYKLSVSDAAYTWADFRAQVLEALHNHFGTQRVSEGRKCLKVETPYLPADVVPCIDYRYYLDYAEPPGTYIEGMTFYIPIESRWIVNYPKVHYDKGVQKNEATDGRFKPTVRILKNLRNRLIDEGHLHDRQAPSYFVECLLANVPDACFLVAHLATLLGALQWLLDADRSELKCLNTIDNLIGEDSQHWSDADCRAFIIETRKWVLSES